MNKKIIIGLIALMGISILAIIIIQLVWMNNAIRVKNELFDRSVNEALNSTAKRMETLQDFRMINHFAFDDSTFRGPMPNRFRPPMPPDFYRNAPRRSAPPKRQSAQQIKMTVKTGKDKNEYEYQISTQYDSPQSGKDTVISISTDSIARSLNVMYAHGINKFDSLLEKLDYRKDTTGKLRRQFEFRTRNLKGVANKALQEIYAWEDDVPIDRVNEVITQELENRNIPIPFEIGIIKGSLITANTIKADSVSLVQSSYRVNMFPNNIFQKNVQLAIYFHGKETFIYKTLKWLLLISLIFSIIILVTFGVSIYFILKQKKISEMKSDFINNMTHEFKTPIATISVAADSISNHKVIENPERVRYFIEMIKKENLRMNRQVEDILTIARLDKKEFEFRWEAIDLHEIIENAIQSIVLQVEKKGGTITSELLATNPIATSDANHFANLIYNLLDNANKYSLNAPEIKISTRNTGKGILIKVEDKGIGMTKTVQSRIFERFYRQTSGNIHNVKGFGLGLSYVKAVLEANRGSISVHSEPGKGSSFEIFIPFIRES